jgi:hypothetical protein
MKFYNFILDKKKVLWSFIILFILRFILLKLDVHWMPIGLIYSILYLSLIEKLERGRNMQLRKLIVVGWLIYLMSLFFVVLSSAEHFMEIILLYYTIYSLASKFEKIDSVFTFFTNMVIYYSPFFIWMKKEMFLGNDGK